MKYIKLLPAMLILASATAACVSMGPNYDPAAVDRLQPGASKANVIAILGRPTTTVMLPNGQQQLMWIHSRGTMLGQGDARAVTLLFDHDRKYVSVASSAETHIR